MTNAADIPYQLRSNKFIDRQMFLDFLARVVLAKGVDKYVYVSMGGKHLVDQESVYRRVGIRNLFTFDGSAGVVERMMCNRPLDDVVCAEMWSSALPGEIDSILQKFKGAENIVVWLDYTHPAKRLSQLQEFAQVLKKAQPGDVIRLTMNADFRTLRGPWEKDGFDGPASYRAWRLFEQIGDYFPNKTEAIPEEGLPAVLGAAVSLAASEAEAETDVRFTPVLLTSYADGQRMFTATVLAHNDGDAMPQGLQGWEFLPAAWSDVVDIRAPDLSIREKVAIDKHLTKEPSQIIEAIGFQPATDPEEAFAAIESYKRLHRFYPTFYAIGIQ